MTLDELVAWLKAQSAAPASGSSLDEIDAQIQLNRVLSAWVEVRRDRGAFGFVFPPDIADEGCKAARSILEEALHDWGAWMVVQFGDEGASIFRVAAERIGFIDGARTLAPSPEIADAIEALRKRWADTGAIEAAWRRVGLLTGTDRMAFGIAPRAEALGCHLAEFEAHFGRPLPEALQKLYATVDGIRVAPMAGAGGDVGFQSVKSDPPRPALVPLSRLVELDEQLRGYFVLGEPCEGFVVCRDDGSVYFWSGAGKPKFLAEDPQDYLRVLEETFGCGLAKHADEAAQKRSRSKRTRSKQRADAKPALPSGIRDWMLDPTSADFSPLVPPERSRLSFKGDDALSAEGLVDAFRPGQVEGFAASTVFEEELIALRCGLVVLKSQSSRFLGDAPKSIQEDAALALMLAGIFRRVAIESNVRSRLAPVLILSDLSASTSKSTEQTLVSALRPCTDRRRTLTLERGVVERLWSNPVLDEVDVDGMITGGSVFLSEDEHGLAVSSAWGVLASLRDPTHVLIGIDDAGCDFYMLPQFFVGCTGHGAVAGLLSGHVR